MSASISRFLVFLIGLAAAPAMTEAPNPYRYLQCDFPVRLRCSETEGCSPFHEPLRDIIVLDEWVFARCYDSSCEMLRPHHNVQGDTVVVSNGDRSSTLSVSGNLGATEITRQGHQVIVSYGRCSDLQADPLFVYNQPPQPGQAGGYETPIRSPPDATRSGLIEGYRAFFRGVDGNHDGRLSPEEWRRSIDAVITQRNADPTPVTDEEHLRQSYMSAFEQDDTNRDRFLTLDELLALPLSTFACADADSNGSLTGAEQEAVIDRCMHLARRLGS